MLVPFLVLQVMSPKIGTAVPTAIAASGMFLVTMVREDLGPMSASARIGKSHVQQMKRPQRTPRKAHGFTDMRFNIEENRISRNRAH
jgi:hypothetical protein